VKVIEGGWVPLIIALCILTIMTSWRSSKNFLSQQSRKLKKPLKSFIKEIQTQDLSIIPGSGVFLAADEGLTPTALHQNVLFNHAIHQNTIIVHVVTTEQPYQIINQSISIEKIESTFFLVKVKVGFKNNIKIPNVLIWQNT